MFKEMIQILKGQETLFDSIRQEFEEMIKTAHHMFAMSTDALLEGKIQGDLKKEVYKMDSTLNSREQTIRREIMTLLSGGQEGPVAACLIMMSMSKDAERLGDYAKNIVQVFEAKPQLGRTEPFHGRFVSLKSNITEIFKKVDEAYHNSDKKLAREIYKDAFKCQKECDDNIKDLLEAKTDENLVAHAVLTRFFKRILAHLSNIATGVFMPVTKIDFFDEKMRDQEVNR